MNAVPGIFLLVLVALLALGLHWGEIGWDAAITLVTLCLISLVLISAFHASPAWIWVSASAILFDSWLIIRILGVVEIHVPRTYR
ncbi:MAG: hypothetical protein ACAH95_11015 [Fimbriimonas sp.]